MTLLDHFRPPLSLRRHWHAFHSAWATYLASHLNGVLPPGYFAEPNVQFGIEIDVAAFDDTRSGRQPEHPGVWSGVEAAVWSPPAPSQTLPFARVTDVAEVLVHRDEGGPVLAAAIELVSPANKDRPAHREAFVSKCETYLQAGLGLVIVDVVTERTANLHDELLARLAAPVAKTLGSELYASAYRTVEKDGQPSLDVWQKTLDLGSPLPTMPLWLRGAICLPVDLHATYDRTCREQRIGPGDER